MSIYTTANLIDKVMTQNISDIYLVLKQFRIFILSLSARFLLLERLRFTFTPNGRREFLRRDPVSPLFSVYSLLLLRKNKQFYVSFNHRNRLERFLSAYFYSEKFSTWIWRQPFVVNVNLNLSINDPPSPQQLKTLLHSRGDGELNTNRLDYNIII